MCFLLSRSSRVQLSVTLWTVASQAPLSMAFPRKEYWSGLPFPSPGDLLNPGIKPMSPALSGRFFTTQFSSVAQSCQTLCNSMDCSQPGSSVHGIFQIRIGEWIVISFFRWSSRPRNQTQISHIAGRLFTIWVTREVLMTICGESNRSTSLANLGHHRREVKSKWEKERYTHLNAGFQGEKKAFLCDKCKEIEENNRMVD